VTIAWREGKSGTKPDAIDQPAAAADWKALFFQAKIGEESVPPPGSHVSHSSLMMNQFAPQSLLLMSEFAPGSSLMMSDFAPGGGAICPMRVAARGGIASAVLNDFFAGVAGRPRAVFA